MSDSVYQRLNIREVNDQRPLSPSVGMSRRASAPSAMLDSTVSSYGNSAKIERYRKWKGDAGGGAATTMDSLSTSTIGRNNMMLRSQVEDSSVIIGRRDCVVCGARLTFTFHDVVHHRSSVSTLDVSTLAKRIRLYCSRDECTPRRCASGGGDRHSRGYI